MARNSPDISGERIGRLTAIMPEGKDRLGHVLWLCKCDCGAMVKRSITTLRQAKKNGVISSCGCYTRDRCKALAKKAGAVRGEQMRKHGFHSERLYPVWKTMRQRCTNPNCSDYEDYGGRGISVCDEWDDYSIFREWAYANGYDKDAPFGKCTLDRIDNSKGYSPSNCQWVDLKAQANNRRTRRCKKK